MVSPPRRASPFINPQPDLAGIEYWSYYEPLYFCPKENFARAVCVTENDFRIFPPEAHRLRLEKDCSGSLFSLFLKT